MFAGAPAASGGDGRHGASSACVVANPTIALLLRYYAKRRAFSQGGVTSFAPICRQNVLEMVHRAKKQRRIVLKRTAAVGF